MSERPHGTERHRRLPEPLVRGRVSLKDPAPQGAVTVGYVAAPGPLLAVPLLASTASEAVDNAALSFLLQQSLDEKKLMEVEEDTKRMAELSLLWSVPYERRSAEQKDRIMALMSRRKRKRKTKLPKTSSACGRYRRRQRQWRVRHAGFAGSCAPRDVFPVAYDWPLLLGNTSGMDQKDSFFVVVMAVAYAMLVLLVSLVPLCSLLSWSGPDAPHHGQYPPEGLLFSGLVLLVFLHLTLCFLLVVRPLMLVGRPAGRSASWPVWTRWTVVLCRAENCGKSAVGVHQQGRLHSCRFAEVDPLV